MFRELRRKDRKIDIKKSEEILTNGEFGIVSSVGEDGYAYGVPLNYVYYNNAIYFHCFVKSGHKLDNFKYSDKVSFCVVGETEVIPEEFTTNYESIVAFGKISEVVGEAKIEPLKKLLEKYSKGFEEHGLKYNQNDIDKTGVYKIQIEHLTGKSNKQQGS